jgi:hypothetical protein
MQEYAIGEIQELQERLKGKLNTSASTECWW